MNSKNANDYTKIIAEHMCLAKDLCVSGSGRWIEFFDLVDSDPQNPKEGHGWLSSMYERRLREKCNSSIEDFYFFLYEYLTADNNYILTTLIQKKTHFFAGYFQKVLDGAYKDFVTLMNDRLNKIFIDDNNNGDKHEFIADNASLSSDKAFPKFHPIHVWQKNQKDFLTLLLRFTYHQKNTYTAALLGYPTDNAVSARVKHIKEKKSSVFSADGKNEAVMLNSWLRHDLYLSFRFPASKGHGGINVFFALPFDCSDPEHTSIRVECWQANGHPLPEGMLRWGNLCCPIKDGNGALLLYDLHVDLDKHKEGKILIQFPDGNQVMGIPRIGKFAPYKHLSDAKIAHLRNASDAPDFFQKSLRDVGKGLTFLFYNNLTYSLWGGPKTLDYSLLKPAEGEAWALFANSGEEGTASVHIEGFVFPLEWRLHPELDVPHSKLLPPALVRLGEKIATQLNVSGWGLYPAFRFFHDRVDFSKLTILGGSDESVASASLTLLTALIHALNGRYKTPVPVFASAQMTFPDGELHAVGHLKQKLKIVKKWRAKYFFVATEQFEEAQTLVKAHALDLNIIPVASNMPINMGKYVAYYFLHELSPDDDELKCVNDENFKLKRTELVTEISAKANLQWDTLKYSKNDFGSITILAGRPGMGKSILMRDLSERWQNHNVFCHVCRTGEKFPVQRFIRNLSWQLAVYSEEFAVRILAELAHGTIPDSANEKEFYALYARFIIAPLHRISIAKASKRHYLLIDGLDEDDSGTIVHLLSNPQYRFPKNFSIVVSTRPVEPLFSEIESIATSVINLDTKDFDAVCGKDLEKFIINLIYGNDIIRQCWENSTVVLDDDELREKIARKDKSFLYANYVLLGIAEGRYHFNRLDQELPAGLTAFYHDSFRYRFPTAEHYEKVRPLLALLTKESKLNVRTASEILKSKNCNEPIGKMIQALRGYCIAEGNELSLSDATLREWLLDPIKNPDFSVL